MGIDTSIYANALRPVKSVQDYDNEYAQAQQNKLMLSLGQQKADEYSRGVERTNRLSSMLGGFAPGMSASDQGDALTRGGFLDEARKVVESGAKAGADKRAEEKAALENAREQIGFINQIIGSARDQASYSQGRQMMASRGMDVSEIPEAFDPAYVQNAGAQTMTQLQRIEDAWKSKKFDLETQKFGEDKRSNRAREATAAGNLSVAQGNLGVSRERLANDKAQTSTGGKAPAGYRWKNDGSLEPIPGGPVTAKTTDQQQKLSDAKTVLDLLDSADPLIDKATSSYAGAGRDQAARVFGVSTGGAQAAAQLKALEGSLISKMPKMSGPQSDKDVLLYKQMAGQIGDPTIPAETKKAASKIIRQINQKYVDDNQKPSAATSAKPSAAGAKFLGFE